LPQYNPQSTPYAEFGDALRQLSAMGPKAIDAASHIALAISFPRQDSFLAAQALISFGPDITATTLPDLIGNLKSQRPETRLYSAIVLGTIGEKASCAVGDIGPLLWDADPYVRYAAAFAIERITGKDLLPGEAKVTPDPLTAHSILPDTPDGKIVGYARTWWTAEGSKVKWHPTYDICDP
jgi:HEAT repeat protein